MRGDSQEQQGMVSCLLDGRTFALLTAARREVGSTKVHLTELGRRLVWAEHASDNLKDLPEFIVRALPNSPTSNPH